MQFSRRIPIESFLPTATKDTGWSCRYFVIFYTKFGTPVKRYFRNIYACSNSIKRWKRRGLKTSKVRILYR